MCVKEGRPNVMLKENSERKIAAPGGTQTQLSWQMLYLVQKWLTWGTSYFKERINVPKLKILLFQLVQFFLRSIREFVERFCCVRAIIALCKLAL